MADAAGPEPRGSVDNETALPPCGCEADFATIERLLVQRRSCRAFLPRPVPHDVIRRILETAQRSASWCNAQPWQVHVVSGSAVAALSTDWSARAASGAAATPELEWPEAYRGVYQQRRRDCGWGLYQALGIARGDREASRTQALENFRFFGAPHVAIVSSERAQGAHGVMDCGAWVAAFMLVATALGVASIAQAALASWPDVLRAHLPFDPDRTIVCGISFGYEDAAHPANGFRTSRAPLDELVTWVSSSVRT